MWLMLLEKMFLSSYFFAILAPLREKTCNIYRGTDSVMAKILAEAIALMVF